MQIHRIPHTTTQRLPDLTSRVVSADSALAGFYRPYANRPDAAHVQQQQKRFTAQQRQTLKDAVEGSIRNKYGISIDKNSVHGSDSVENAKIEIDFFFKD